MGKSRKQQVILAQSFFDKGCDYWYSCDYDEALEEFTKSLVLRESLLGKYHMHTSRTYFSMSCALHGKGDGDAALIALRRTMRIAIIKKDKGRIQAAKDYINWVLKKEGGYSDKHIAEYIRKLEESISHESKGDQISSAGGSGGGEGNIKALEEYKKALEIEMEEAGTSHTDVADLYVKIAGAIGKGKKDAIEYYKKALDIYKEAFGENHEYVTETTMKMDPAKANSSQGTPRAIPTRGLSKQISVQDLVKSDQNASKVDKAVQRFHREDKAEFCQTGRCYDTVGRYFWMGVGFYKNNNSDEALVAFRRAWRMRDATFGREHQLTKHVLKWISDVLSAQGQPVESYQRNMYQSVDHERNGHALLLEGKKIPALREFQRAAELEKSTVGKNHLEFADLKYIIGELQSDKGDYDKALTEFKIALLIYQNAFGPNHPRTASVVGKMNALAKSSNILLSVSSHSAQPLSGRCSRRSLSGLGSSTRKLIR